jgi:hypothetical protein
MSQRLARNTLIKALSRSALFPLENPRTTATTMNSKGGSGRSGSCVLSNLIGNAESCFSDMLHIHRRSGEIGENDIIAERLVQIVAASLNRCLHGQHHHADIPSAFL